MPPAKRKTRNNSHPLLIAGLVLIALTLPYRLYQMRRYSFDSAPVAVTNTLTAPATKIKIPRIKLDQPILEATIQNNIWQVSNDGISHLQTSANPKQEGGIILYGHNTNDRFGPIRWLENGDIIEITTTDNNIHKYSVSQILTVSPSQVDVLASDTEVLILYTCTGFLDSQRFVVKATPQ